MNTIMSLVFLGIQPNKVAVYAIESTLGIALIEPLLISIRIFFKGFAWIHTTGVGAFTREFVHGIMITEIPGRHTVFQQRFVHIGNHFVAILHGHATKTLTLFASTQRVIVIEERR